MNIISGLFISLFFESFFVNVIHCERRIVGGVKIEIENFPFIVSIQKEKIHKCGGTLVTLSWVLTASHCLYSKGQPINMDILTVMAGTTEFSKYSLLSPKMQEHNVVYMITYSGKPAPYSVDVGLVKTANPFRENRAVSVVRLPSQSADSSNKYENLKKIISKPCQVVGWGFTESVPVGKESKITAADMADHLSVADVNVIAPKACRKKHLDVGKKILPMHVCTLSKNADACVGDSGGPLICDGIQYGIISFGFGCKDKYPGVNVRTDFFLNWIKDQTSKNAASNTATRRNLNTRNDRPNEDKTFQQTNEPKEFQNTKNNIHNYNANENRKYERRSLAICCNSHFYYLLIFFLILKCI